MNRRLSNYFKRKFLLLAKDLLDNPQALKFRIEGVKERLDRKAVKETFGKSFNDLKTLVRLVKAYSSRKFRKVTNQSIVICIAAVIYFLTPTDFIPDFILGIGYLDDLAVFRWALNQIGPDLDSFKEWEAENKKTNKKTDEKRQKKKGVVNEKQAKKKI